MKLGLKLSVKQVFLELQVAKEDCWKNKSQNKTVEETCAVPANKSQNKTVGKTSRKTRLLEETSVLSCIVMP